MLGDGAARMAAALLPPRCLVCGDHARNATARDLCAACIDDLPWNVHRCARCALPLPAAAPACGICQRRPPPFVQAFAPLLYAPPVDRLLLRFKFHADLAAGRVLARVLVDAIGDWEPSRAIDRIVPLPLHRSRLAQRGYNQTLELARPLAAHLARPLDAHALRRTRATAAQSDLDAPARRRNVRNAFAATDMAGANILLLDDVITTGTTAREAAATLLRAGAAAVHVCAIARAP